MSACEECRTNKAEIKCTTCGMKVCRGCAEYHSAGHGHEVFKNPKEYANIMRRLKA